MLKLTWPAAWRASAAMLTLAACVSAASAAAQDADTARLPRVEGGTEVFASPNTTLYTSPETVTATAAATDKALAAQGWQAYRPPFTEISKTLNTEIRALKKGSIALTVFITVASAQNNATSVQYAFVPLDNDLPFPADAAEILFDPHRPYLKCLSGQPVAATLAFFRREMAAQGWTAWSDAPGANRNAFLNDAKRAQEFFIRSGKTPLLFAAALGEGGRTVIEIKATPESALPRAGAEPAPAAKPPVKPAAKVDAMADDVTKMAGQLAAEAMAEIKAPGKTPGGGGADDPVAPLDGNVAPVPLPANAQGIEFKGDDGSLAFSSASSVKALAVFYRAQMKSLAWKERPTVINSPSMAALEFAKDGKDLSFTIMQFGGHVNVSANGSGLLMAAAEKPAAAATTDSAALTAQDADAALPIPVQHSSSGNSQTPFRVEASASVPASLTAVLAFYRAELAKRGWKEAAGADVKADKAQLAFAAPDGPAVLKLSRASNETTVSLALRKPAEAQKAGVLPKLGQAMLIFGNTLEAETVITLNKTAVKVAAKAGAKGTDGPRLELAPGKYKFAVKTAGKAAQSGDVEVGADEIWGVLIGPGGGLALQMY